MGSGRINDQTRNENGLGRPSAKSRGGKRRYGAGTASCLALLVIAGSSETQGEVVVLKLCRAGS